MTLVVVIVGVLGCPSPEKASEATKAAHTTREVPSYGDPIGLRVSGPNASELDVAVAATRGRDVTAGVNKLATALHGASRACPELGSLGGSGSLQVRLTVVGGKFNTSENLPDSPLALCVVRALDGKEILPSTEDLALLIEFRRHSAGETH